MKAICKHMILMAGVLALVHANVDIDDEEILATPPVEETPVTPQSTFRLRGSYDPKVHLLSQLSIEPNPNVKAALIFPNQDLPLSLTQGVTIRALAALDNHGPESIYVKNFTGAFIEVIHGKNIEEQPTLKYAQNLTIDSSFNGVEVGPGSTISLAFEFFPFTSLRAPNTYTL